MELDRELYQKYYAALREWSEDKYLQQVMDARQLTPEQAWNRYIALWELLEQFSNQDKSSGRLEHLKAWKNYYSIAQRLYDFQMKNGE